MRSKRDARVHRVTGVRVSRSDDIHQRYRRYLITMTIRTGCFITAVLTTGPTRWVMFAGALVLPYLAVVAANGGRGPGKDDSTPPVILPSRTQLPPGPPR